MKSLIVILSSFIVVSIVYRHQTLNIPRCVAKVDSLWDKPQGYIHPLKFTKYKRWLHINEKHHRVNCTYPVVLFWLNVTSEGAWLKQQTEHTHRFQQRDVCVLAKLWRNKGFTDIYVISRFRVNCDVVTILRSDLNIPSNIINPFKLEWFLRNLRLDSYLYIQDDIYPVINKKCYMISEFLYTKHKLHLYTDGDQAYINSAKAMYLLGNEFVNTPRNWVAHGPQLIHTKDVLIVHKLMESYIDSIPPTRGVRDIAFLGAMGAYYLTKGRASYQPNNYFHYTNTIKVNQDIISIRGHEYYCMNDAELIMDAQSVNELVFNISMIS